MNQAKIDEMFNEESFVGRTFQQTWCSAPGLNGDTVRLIVVVYPFNDMLQYRVEYDHGSLTYDTFKNFADALRRFRELI